MGSAAIVYFYACTVCGASGPDAKTNGAPTTYACDVPQGDPYYCPKCRAGLIPADEHAQPGEAIGLIDATPEARWVVLDRSGDQVTIRPLGLPGFRSSVVSVAEIRPQFSYQLLERAGRR